MPNHHKIQNEKQLRKEIKKGKPDILIKKSHT